MNNRKRGNNFELVIIKKLKEIGFNRAVSSRAESRQRDAAKVDICYVEPYNFQCKNVVGKLNYHEVLAEMPDEKNNHNIVVHKMTYRTPAGRFHPIGTYAILDFEDLLKIISKSRSLEQEVAGLRKIIDCQT